MKIFINRRIYKNFDNNECIDLIDEYNYLIKIFMLQNRIFNQNEMFTRTRYYEIRTFVRTRCYETNL